MRQTVYQLWFSRVPYDTSTLKNTHRFLKGNNWENFHVLTLLSLLNHINLLWQYNLRNGVTVLPWNVAGGPETKPPKRMMYIDFKVTMRLYNICLPQKTKDQKWSYPLHLILSHISFSTFWILSAHIFVVTKESLHLCLPSRKEKTKSGSTF